MAKVSVLIPVYNAEEYLPQCLEAVLGQSLYDIEIICVNDGSTDESLSILKKYEMHDSRIVLVDKPNGGYGSALNAAFSKATGVYIGIVEPDDFIAKEMFERLYQAAHDNDCCMVKSNRFDYMRGKASFVETHKESCCDVVFRPMDNKDFFLKAPSTWAGIYKKQMLVNYGIGWNETPGAAFQDTGFAFKVAACAQRAMLLHDAFYYYRRDNENSSTNSLGNAFAICEEFRLIEVWLNNNQSVKTQVLDIYTAFKWKTYMWNYKRIDWLYKYAFAEAVAADLREQDRRGELDSQFMSDARWANMTELLESPELFVRKRFEKVAGTRSVESLLKDNKALAKELASAKRPFRKKVKTAIKRKMKQV